VNLYKHVFHLTPFDSLKCVSNNIQMLPNITNVKFQHLTCLAQLPSRALACSGSPLDCCVITPKNWKTTSLGPFWVFFWVLLCNLIGTNSRERLSHWQVPTRSEYERFPLRFNVDMCKAAVYKLYQVVKPVLALLAGSSLNDSNSPTQNLDILDLRSDLKRTGNLGRCSRFFAPADV
jgi:hypothetical protein